VEEGTFRNEKDFSTKAEAMRRADYNIEVIGVATSREQSRLSVLERRENLREFGRPPRDVPEQYQDDAYQGYTNNMIADTAKLDRVRVVNRAGVTLYDSANQDASLNRSTFEALENGRKLSDKQIAKLAQNWQSLHEKGEAKGLQGDDMTRIMEGKKNFEAFVCGEKQKYALKSVEKNAQTLERDSRFAVYSNDELLKAAYWRGVSGKDQIFRDKTPDFQVLDTKLADRAALQKLPDIDELKGMEITHEKPQGKTRDRDDHGLER
jgi:hypothetical protein